MTTRLKNLKSIKRKPMRLSQDSLVKTRPLFEDKILPLLLEPSMSGVNLAAWVREHRTHLEDLLTKHGALLFRGFGLETVEAFRDLAAAMSDDLLDYTERAAPRTQMSQKVFTSTEYPADQWIPLHHEMSYSHNWPSKLYFFCLTPPASGGFTPVTWERDIIQKIPDRIKDTFYERGVMYVRNYGQGVDMPWWEVFQTKDKAAIEAYFEKTQTEFEWVGKDQLRTRMRRQVTATHPKTGDEVWFNHAHMFHISNMPETVRKALLLEFTQEELPRNSFYGDGTPIEDEVAAEIREIYRSNAIMFPWQKGDVMVLDNFLTAHGRSPFQGARQICVAMSELYTNPDYR